MTGQNDNTPPVAEAMGPIIERLLAILKSLLAVSPEVATLLEGLIPVLARLALDEGIDAAVAAMEGLAGEQTADHWHWIMQRASHAERMTLMEASRQAAISDTVQKIRTEQARWDAIIASLKFLVALAPLLL